MRQLALIIHNVRSCHNVGSLLRTAEGLGVSKVYLSGYTPYPAGGANDERLPHIAAKLDGQIHKTALGAERLMAWEYIKNVFALIEGLRRDSFRITALEQATNSIKLPGYQAPAKLALIVGREVEGVEPEVLAAANDILEIPMLGAKESFNVAVAAAIALYHCRFFGSNL